MVLGGFFICVFRCLLWIARPLVCLKELGLCKVIFPVLGLVSAPAFASSCLLWVVLYFFVVACAVCFVFFCCLARVALLNFSFVVGVRGGPFVLCST